MQMVKNEIENLKKDLERILQVSTERTGPIAELDLNVNPKETYLFANREGFLKIAKFCLELASEDSSNEGSHIHLDLEKMFKDSDKPLVLELRNDWNNN
jgi:hypothetical protein